MPFAREEDEVPMKRGEYRARGLGSDVCRNTGFFTQDPRRIACLEMLIGYVSVGVVDSRAFWGCTDGM